MELKKMSLANIQGKLSRTEMKGIMAGSGSGPGGGTCIGSTGSWTYTSSTTWANCIRDIATYCSSGSGTCS